MWLQRPCAALLVLLVLLVLALDEADGKGGGGFGGFRTSSVRRSSARGSAARVPRSRAPASTNPYYRGHPEPSRACIGCYYSSGMYYDRTFMFMYLGMAYHCTSCAGRSSVDVDSLQMSLPAITAVADVDLNGAWYPDEVLAPGSSEFATFTAELSDIISKLTDDAIPASSCLVTGLAPRRGFAQARLHDAELRVAANVTILLEAENVDAAFVVESLRKNCASRMPRGAQLGHWVLPHCLTGVGFTTVELTSALGETPIPVKAQEPGGGILGDLLLAFLVIALAAWCCASYAERRAELVMLETPHRPRARAARGYGQLQGSDSDSDNSDESEERSGQESLQMGILKLPSQTIPADAQPVVHAVAVRAAPSGDCSGHARQQEDTVPKATALLVSNDELRQLSLETKSR
eukprot:COSAG02_NODE_2357_length_9069_cov_13.218841_5_plen_407_part_00